MEKKTYITILRGINVSASNMIKMPVLQKIFEDAGYENVKTYIQSGNVLFNQKKSNEEEMAKYIREKIKEGTGSDVPVLVLELEDLKKVQQGNPFLKNRQEDVTKLHVTFLAKEPEKERFEKIEIEKYLPDEFILDAKSLYLFCPNGYGKTKLNNNFFENKLKLDATTRNWKTVNELVRLGEELAGLI
jgi:uncharacterized protein (DUF1697 family)